MLAKEEAFIERFKARASHAAQVQSRVKKLDKIEKIEPPKRRKIGRVRLPAGRRARATTWSSSSGVDKGYGTRTIYDGFDLLIRRRERWCVMGVNGAGKIDAAQADRRRSRSPTRAASRSARASSWATSRSTRWSCSTPSSTVFETLQARVPARPAIGSLRSLAGAFGFSGDDVDKPCRVLSGGEKARLVLAKMLFDPPNFLVLDEPTNHLDMATKEMLVEALTDFEGTMLFVSHDRHFSARARNRVLELTPEGAHAYGGGYDEYVAQSGHEAPGVS